MTTVKSSPTAPARAPKPLKGTTVLSLALNLPGPAALMRCRQLGATCLKLEPPGPPGQLGRDGKPLSGDPMGQYNPAAYADLHQGVKIYTADLKTAAGQQRLHALLARTDVLLTSFRPSALAKLGLGWTTLKRRYAQLSQVAIVGAPSPRAEIPGHDLTYLAENGLVTGLDLPPTLYADMGGALAAAEAVLQATLLRQTQNKSCYLEVGLSSAAEWLALPRRWGLTKPSGAVGGAHAGYRVYRALDGRVAVAALEPHFAQKLCQAAGLAGAMTRSTMLEPATHAALERFFAGLNRSQIDALAAQFDLPLHALT